MSLPIQIRVTLERTQTQYRDYYLDDLQALCGRPGARAEELVELIDSQTENLGALYEDLEAHGFKSGGEWTSETEIVVGDRCPNCGGTDLRFSGGYGFCVRCRKTAPVAEFEAGG